MKLYSKGHCLRIRCGSAPQPGLQEVSTKKKKQITSSCIVGMSTMFCVVSPGSKSGHVLKPSTATWARHISQPASRIVKVVRVCSGDAPQIPEHKNCEANVNSEFIVERVMSPKNKTKKNVEQTSGISTLLLRSIISTQFNSVQDRIRRPNGVSRDGPNLVSTVS